MRPDTVLRLAKEANVSIRGHYDEGGSTPQELERFAALVAAAEREACAQVCDRWTMVNHVYTNGALRCAKDIRARSEA